MRDSLTAIGRGSTFVGLIFVLGGRNASHPWMVLAGKVLIGVGIILLIVHFWKQPGR